MIPILCDKTEITGFVHVKEKDKKDSISVKYDIGFLMDLLEFLKWLNERMGVNEVEIRMKKNYPIMIHLSDDVAFAVAPLLRDSERVGMDWSK